MSLLRLTSVHAKAMATLHALCFEVPWSEKAFRDLLILPTYQAFGWINEDQDLRAFILLNACEPELEILTICVHPANQRQGLAYSLASEILRQSTGFERCFLEVSEFNYSALALYSKLGFVQTSIRKNYYRFPDGRYENALLMNFALE